MPARAARPGRQRGGGRGRRQRLVGRLPRRGAGRLAGGGRRVPRLERGLRGGLQPRHRRLARRVGADAEQRHGGAPALPPEAARRGRQRGAGRWHDPAAGAAAGARPAELHGRRHPSGRLGARSRAHAISAPASTSTQAPLRRILTQAGCGDPPSSRRLPRARGLSRRKRRRRRGRAPRSPLPRGFRRARARASSPSGRARASRAERFR